MAPTPKPPKVEFVPMNNWALKDLKDTFVIPEFERRVDKSHLRKMVQSIMNNEFYDTIIRGTKLKNGKIQVIDAQHRIAAFIVCNESYGLQKYDFMLALYDEKEARKIYRKLNVGKRLVASDHTLAMDNGGVPFFNELRGLVSHYKTAMKMSFTDAISLWVYCSVGTTHSHLEQLENYISKLKAADIKFTKKFLTIFIDAAGIGPSNNPLYRAPMIRSAARLAYRKKLSDFRIKRMIEIMSRYEWPEELRKRQSGFAFAEVTKIIEVEILPQIK